MVYSGVLTSHLPYLLLTVVYMVYFGIFSFQKPSEGVDTNEVHPIQIAAGAHHAVKAKHPSGAFYYAGHVVSAIDKEPCTLHFYPVKQQHCGFPRWVIARPQRIEVATRFSRPPPVLA